MYYSSASTKPEYPHPSTLLVQKWTVFLKCIHCGKKKREIRSSDDPGSYSSTDFWLCQECSNENPLDEVLKRLKRRLLAGRD